MLAEWLYDAAVLAGFPAQSTSVPGVAQRTGATTYYIEVFPVATASLGGRRPVFSLNPVPGELDLLVSSELLETLRQVGNGMSSPQRTMVISSTTRALTVAEKMVMGDGRMDATRLAATLQPQCRRAELLDLQALAQQSGTAISAVLLGAIAASGVLPLPRETYEQAVRRSGKGVEASLRGFARAFEVLGERQAQSAIIEQALAPAAPPAPVMAAPPDLRALARQRLTDYQDAAYARLYDQRLQRIEAAAGASETGRGALAEVTRWLALWMAFDDIVRVAGAKLAASRQLRVRRETQAGDEDLVRIWDHFKPGVPEFAALLPEGPARRLLAWDRRRVAAGAEPWALPLKVGSHSVRGTLALRLLSACRFLRRRGSRFALEQQLIERWLGAVERGLREDAALGFELAACGRLVKGYGSTNERGKDNLLHLIDHLAFAPGLDAPARAQAVKTSREAALADDAGTAFDRSLQAHGAAARPLREHTVRWYKRRPSSA